ncbi:contractile injection system tape measure protein [uncultured Kordia sp.]|uniref:contractile injection system tape measure protein n=1 Tax=uncultured Kordia sp. TaxID=507699 RepID=UPI002627E45F|nr:contractile injection system tape measure protein [uncultured Kordia sp.]
MHTIHNIAFEIDVNHEGQQLSWEEYYAKFFEDRLLPKIENLCNNWDAKHPNRKCSIDEIDMNVEVDSLNLEELQEKIITKINDQLHILNENGTTANGSVRATITSLASPFDALVQYLKTGILPAYISVKIFKEWLGNIIQFTTAEKTTLTALFSKNSITIERMLSLLRNNYEKFAEIIEADQKITKQYIKLEKTFFKKFVKAICEKSQITYQEKQTEIWFKTLGLSSSLAQFSKTFLQLFEPKALTEQKRLVNTNAHYLSVAILQAIIQNELQQSIQISIAKIFDIISVVSSESKTEDKSHKIIDQTKSKKTDDIENKVEITSSQNAQNDVDVTKNTTQDKNTDQTKKITKSSKEIENKANEVGNTTIQNRSEDVQNEIDRKDISKTNTNKQPILDNNQKEVVKEKNLTKSELTQNSKKTIQTSKESNQRSNNQIENSQKVVNTKTENISNDSTSFNREVNNEIATQSKENTTKGNIVENNTSVNKHLQEKEESNLSTSSDNINTVETSNVFENEKNTENVGVAKSNSNAEKLANKENIENTNSTVKGSIVINSQENSDTTSKPAIDNTIFEKLSRNNILVREIPLTTEKAGLILLNPFLARFFEGAKLVDANNKISDIGKACMLLHFLATGTEDVTDVELTLEKLCLGIPLDTIINYQIPLTEADKALCDELLQAVIQHWSVLKNSSANTLRDMFLKREGNITLKEDSIKLVVERLAQDILLDKVPWSIGLFQLKWMDKRMHIEW